MLVLHQREVYNECLLQNSVEDTKRTFDVVKCEEVAREFLGFCVSPDSDKTTASFEGGKVGEETEEEHTASSHL